MNVNFEKKLFCGLTWPTTDSDKLSDNCGHFHSFIFAKMKEFEHVIIEMDKVDYQILNSEKLVDEMVIWWADLKARYDWDPSIAPFPMVSEGVYMHGHVVKTKINVNAYSNHSHYNNGTPPLWWFISDESKFADEWIWILNHTKGKVQHIFPYWIFEDPAEAVLFTLGAPEFEDSE